MNDFRESLGWIIGSAVAGAVAVVSWIFESGLLATLLGIMIGAGLTYFVQTRTQKRTWEREYSIKIVEEVYGALFREIRSNIRTLKLKFYSGLSFQTWSTFQDDHRYFMVDEGFGRVTGDNQRRLCEIADCGNKSSRSTPNVTPGKTWFRAEPSKEFLG